MDSLTKYIFDNYYMYMTLTENMAWRYFVFKEQGNTDAAKNYERGNFGTEVSRFIKMGEVEFYNFVRDRIMNQYREKILLNYCPKCGHLTRTPESKQCFKCKYKWHQLTV